ncbi:MAG: DUF6150 family protein, partial [Methylophilaceae bacterium]|nr:DUF6150 family protein [Methylophilaceae bacterium]
FVVNNDSQADIKCFKVNQINQADLLVYVVDNDYLAGADFKWFYVSQEYQASKKICWVDHDYQADLKVFFVSNEYQAQWNRGHALQHRF